MKADTGRLYAFAWRHAGKLPGSVVRGVGNIAADAVWLRRGAGVRRLEANYARVRPDLDARAVRRLSRAGMRSYVRYFGEAFTLTASSPAQIDARVRASGLDELKERLAAGETAVLALGHLGNWDLAGAWAGRNVGLVTTVAERLEPEEVFQEFLAFREGLGMQILALGDGDVFRDLLRVARAPSGLIPLLADRDLTAKGIEVEMAGRRARVAAGPAALAVASRSTLMCTVISYERLTGARRRAAGTPWGIHIEFGAALTAPEGMSRNEQVRFLTERWVAELTDGIRRHTADWHMLQKVFIEDLDPERYAATLAREAAA